MFVDRGVPILFRKSYELGASKKLLVVKVAGGAHGRPNRGGQDFFKIGLRNMSMLKELFMQNRIKIQSEDVGGSWSRTVSLDVATGLVTVTARGSTEVL